MPRARAVLALAALALPAAITACGADDEPVRDRDNQLHLRLDEYRIRPARLLVREGRLTITVRNEGVLTHNVKVETVPDDFEERPVVLGGTDTAHPGETTTKALVLPRGEYRLACTIANHDELGQYGALEVR